MQRAVLPRADLPQPSSSQRAPPPCATQRAVLPTADLLQPSSSQRAPPPCAMQWAVLPRAALPQPSSSQRAPPPCAAQRAVLPCANLLQPSSSQRAPPPRAMQRRFAPQAASLPQPSSSQAFLFRFGFSAAGFGAVRAGRVAACAIPISYWSRVRVEVNPKAYTHVQLRHSSLTWAMAFLANTLITASCSFGIDPWRHTAQTSSCPG